MSTSFAECLVLSELWKFTEGFILREFGITIKLYSTDILFGVQRSNKHTHEKNDLIKKINLVILIAKMCKSIFKKKKKKIELAIFPGYNI